jgi:hypothetical protein
VKAAGDSFKLVESFSAVFQASKLICELGVVADIYEAHDLRSWNPELSDPTPASARELVPNRADFRGFSGS